MKRHIPNYLARLPRDNGFHFAQTGVQFQSGNPSHLAGKLVCATPALGQARKVAKWFVIRDAFMRFKFGECRNYLAAAGKMPTLKPERQQL